jgi:hypothetical protein
VTNKYKDKIDFLDIEIKLCTLIKKIFILIKYWFRMFKTYNYRDARILNLRQQIQELLDSLQINSPERGDDHSPKTLKKLQKKRDSIKSSIMDLIEADKDLYADIKATVIENSKLLNFCIKFLNYPEYYFKSNHGMTMIQPVRASVEPQRAVGLFI